jgi:hypothetical protein
MDDLAKAYRGWVEEVVQKAGCFREEKWRECVAVGRNGSFELKELQAAYRGILRHENAGLSPQNKYFWEDIRFIST